MNLLLSIALAAAAFFQAATPVTPTNYYVRVDGGSRISANKPLGNGGQCDGREDIAYSPSITDGKCAWGKLSYVDFDGSYEYAPILGIVGGDIVHIGPGAFPVGLNSLDPKQYDGTAVAGAPFGAALPTIPAGTPEYPTTFIGAGSDKTQVYGVNGAGAIMNLTAANLVVEGIEFTDHGQCSKFGTVPTNLQCVPGTSDYVNNGLNTDINTSNLTLKDVNIHGFVAQGIIGPVGGLVTLDHVRIAFNGAAGWNFDDGNGTQSINNASIVASYLTVEGNGCNEEYPIVHPGFPALNCADQSNIGYGDGVGTPGTPLNFTCDHCTFRYNTQDGLDLLHTSGSVIKVTNSTSYGNMGQQWKFGAMASVLFENNITDHNCQRMKYPIGGNSTFMTFGLSLYCRAGGDGIAINIDDDGTYLFANNSYAGYGNTTYDIACGGTCNHSSITLENNLSIGYTRPVPDGETPGVFYDSTNPSDLGYFPAAPTINESHDIFYNFRSCPTGDDCTDPHVANEPTDAQVQADETVLDNIDFHLTSASVNAAGKGTGGTDIGAYGVAAITTPPAGDGTGSSGTSTTTPPQPTGFSISIELSCVPSGTAYTCANKN